MGHATAVERMYQIQVVMKYSIVCLKRFVLNLNREGFP